MQSDFVSSLMILLVKSIILRIFSTNCWIVISIPYLILIKSGPLKGSEKNRVSLSNESKKQSHRHGEITVQKVPVWCTSYPRV